MSKRKIFLEDIMQEYQEESYQKVYERVLYQINTGKLTPIKASGTNGKRPSLINAYWEIIESVDYSEVLEELKYQTNPAIDITYYSQHPQAYMKVREYVRLVSTYLDQKVDNKNVPVTINERSFDIFHDEKYLDRNGGRELLSAIGFSGERLHFYETSEPMSYYSHHKKTPQNFLIIENKDTFYSMRKHLIEGNDQILGLSVGTLIYGRGKGIYKTFNDFVKSVEPYFNNEKNKLFYFGDLDYEGILIYETLCESYKIDIKLFNVAYETMLLKGSKIPRSELPTMKKGQNMNIGNHFLDQFESNTQKEIMDILQSGKYIPQEILNANDYTQNKW